MHLQYVKKPWGHEEILEHNEHYVVKQLFVKKGHRLSLQYHEMKHETLFVVEGFGRFEITKSRMQVPAFKGQMLVVPPKTVHRIEAHPLHDLVILECSTTQLDDVVRLEDDYERE